MHRFNSLYHDPSSNSVLTALVLASQPKPLPDTTPSWKTHAHAALTDEQRLSEDCVFNAMPADFSKPSNVKGYESITFIVDPFRNSGNCTVVSKGDTGYWHWDKDFGNGQKRAFLGWIWGDNRAQASAIYKTHFANK